MWQIICDYWIGFLCAAIGGAVTLAGKKIWNYFRKNYERDANEKNNQLLEIFLKKSDEDDAIILDKLSDIKDSFEDRLDYIEGELEEQNEAQEQSIGILRSGVLSLHKERFLKLCNKLLTKDKITLEEYLELEEEHNVYKSLGGNHAGDMAWEAVKSKFDNQ